MENNESNIFQNIEQIKMISKLMGASSAEQNSMDIVKMMETAKKFSTMMNLFNKKPQIEEKRQEEKRQEEKRGEEKRQEEKKEEVIEVIDAFSPSRQMKLISAAIPFLDKEYQKNIFIAIRLMEMKKAMGTDVVMMQKQETQKENTVQRRNKMLAAMRPYLNHDEKQKLDVLIRAIEMKKIFDTGKEEV